MKITDVRIKKVEGSTRLKAVASITFDDAFAVHDLRIIEGAKGLFIAMPSRKTSQGEYKDVAHPINPETREEIEKTVLAKYAEVETNPEEN